MAARRTQLVLPLDEWTDWGHVMVTQDEDPTRAQELSAWYQSLLKRIDAKHALRALGSVTDSEVERRALELMRLHQLAPTEALRRAQQEEAA